MAIPEHVKRQAMDAVSHQETTAQIRLYSNNPDAAPKSFNEPSKEPPARVQRGPIPDDVKRQAMDAVAHKETTAQIRLVKDNGSLSPTPTPNKESTKAAEKIAQMHRDGQGVDTVQDAATKDGFGRG